MQRRRLFRAVMLSALAFWLAGGGCLLGCEKISEAASSHQAAESRPAPDTSSASGDGHECCRMKRRRGGEAQAARDQNALKSLPQPHGLMTCYALGGQMSETPRSLRVTGASLPAQPVVAPPRLVAANYERPVERLPRVADRGGTHLRYCVFLI
ncbi:MAG TPA: hypothetical protein VGV59_00515 [Pyrinomonadaceae bacterium]|nr:hypothetical protein [Pyrinomonadaceae bacterium]